jgi:hypothetical protein
MFNVHARIHSLFICINIRSDIHRHVKWMMKKKDIPLFNRVFVSLSLNY